VKGRVIAASFVALESFTASGKLVVRDRPFGGGFGVCVLI
jgi:hypothetical protein